MAGRRSGKTVTEVAEAGVTCIEDRGYCGWGAPNFPILRDAWRDLKAEFAPFIKQVRESEWTIEFLSGGRLECWSMDSGIVARGRKYHKFIIDEAGLVQNLALRFDAEIEPTLADYDGVLVAGSTPNLVGPDLLTWFNLGQRPDTGWASWRWSSLDNPAVASNIAKLIERSRARGVPDWLIRQEYYAEPAESDRAFFRTADLDLHRAKYGTEPYERGTLDVDTAHYVERFASIRDGKHGHLVFKRDPSGALRLWGRPDNTVQNCIGVDLGYGVGSSNTVFSVGERPGRRKVAEYAWPGVTPDEAAVLCAALGWWYRGPNGPATICFERNGPGELFAKRMHDLNYPNLWFERKAPSDFAYTGTTDKYGWNNNPASKEYVLGNYRAAMIGGTFTNPSLAALDECRTYIYDDQMRITSVFERTKSKDDPARVKHGDRVIADALLCLCFDWTEGPHSKPVPAFHPGTYGHLFDLEKKMPDLFGKPKVGFLPGNR